VDNFSLKDKAAREEIDIWIGGTKTKASFEGGGKGVMVRAITGRWTVEGKVISGERGLRM